MENFENNLLRQFQIKDYFMHFFYKEYVLYELLEELSVTTFIAKYISYSTFV